MGYKIGDKVIVLESGFTNKNNLVGRKGIIIDLPVFIESGFFRVSMSPYEDTGILLSYVEIKKDSTFYYGI